MRRPPRRPAPPRSLTLPGGDFEPAYLALHRSGELRRRAAEALDMLSSCRLCPRACGVDRLREAAGVCRTGRLAAVSSFFGHRGEESCLSGRRGSGAFFFSRCNLGCVFCQNCRISRMGEGVPSSAGQMAEMMLRLQEEGCHNINLVTPSHVVPQILEALALAVEGGLRLPLVYNTSAYDSAESLRLLDGVVDIYMPDFKFRDPALAERYLRARDYPEAALRSVAEMHRQVGDLETDRQGLARRGLLVRHLLMPGLLEDTKKILSFLAGLSRDTWINILTQYRPANQVSALTFPEINRPVSREEYYAALDHFKSLGLHRLD